ncbi:MULTISPECIES: small acid-soluble spore protein H [Alkalihalophilus]|uniref:Small, acid-soluble spore protein H n=2 Tax=Alkalihalophilus TaxID=2893060 RepID=D3FY75_ALKPO|nr:MULTISPECIES: small acid-soluble spore protein H [Alkalihalophilus]ADC49098.1 acid-soluble spore protein H [Alkalihalophilus pseudofirmus OF4]ERN52289.1 acid-soluble spore protein H [Alkalihalophilus marmarensis DSM 21297]MEC2071181.1 small acid-soluble spore protein H [Alkalihalophilus marmarensis]OLS35234.1 small, acid-soluble spore protein, H family [Alkalihalophilus pseudofirmus]WEG16483.1 small acid-soluble spore protein H [Alkalihalophilus pseudofirmus]
MNSLRAQEIAASPVMANVMYNEQAVYIQHVDEGAQMARIYPLNEPNNEQDVPLSQLVEQ